MNARTTLESPSELGEAVLIAEAARMLGKLDQDAQERAIGWIRNRLQQDRRVRQAAASQAAIPGIKATWWTAHWSDSEWMTAGTWPELMRELDENWDEGAPPVIHCTGTATVQSRWVVRHLLHDGDGPVPEFAEFDSREKAEAFLASIEKEARRPAPDAPEASPTPE